MLVLPFECFKKNYLQLTDVNFFRYYQRLNEHLERVFEQPVKVKGKMVKLDFTKQLSKEEFAVKLEKEMQNYMRNKPLTKTVSLGRYVSSDGTASSMFHILTLLVLLIEVRKTKQQ